MPVSNYCLGCIFHVSGDHCLAFDKIPVEIFTGQVEHTEVLKNQYGEYIFIDKSEDISDFLKK